MRTRLFLGILVIWHSVVFSLSVDDFSIERLPINDELAHTEIKCLYQDFLGYLWIGTAGGLERFDGFSLVTFHHNPDDSASLPNEMVTNIFEDKAHRLYVGTHGGLARYDRATNTFTIIISAPVSRTALDDRGIVWMGTDKHGLVRFNTITETVEFYHDDSPDSASIKTNILHSTLLDQDNDLWIGHDAAGVELFPHHAAKHYFDLPNLPATPKDRKIVNVLGQDQNGLIWAGTQFCGLHLIDKQQSRVIPPHSRYNIPPLVEQNLFWTLLPEKDRMWIGVNNGLYLYDFAADTCVQLFGTPELQKTATSETVISLYRDRQKTLWMGTKSGLHQIRERTTVRHYKDFLPNLADKQNQVWSFLSEGDSIWVGMALGLLKWQRHTGRFELFKPPDDVPIVRQVVRKGANELYALTLGGKLHLFDTAQEKFTRVIHLQPGKFFHHSGYVAQYDWRGLLWIGTNIGGLYRYSPQDGIKQNYRYPATTMTNWIIDIQPDSARDCLWCGTWANGLWRFNRQADRLEPFNDIFSAFVGKLPTIFCLEPDSLGNLWLGTYGDGLFYLNLTTKKAQVFTQKDGLPSNIIYSIVTDLKKRLWLGTNRGLGRFDPRTGECMPMDTDDGLRGLDMNVGATALTQAGELLFGGDNGFNVIDPNYGEDSSPPMIALNDVKRFGQSVPPQQLSRSNGTLKFSYKETFLSLEFAVLHFDNPAKNRLKYRIPSLSDQWIDLGQGRTVFLTNMNPGHYRLELLAANNRGVWMAQPYTLTVIITPPCWQRAWFYLVVGAGLSGLVWLVFAVRLRRKMEIEHVKAAEREATRQKLAMDFHDQVGPHLTKISVISQLLRLKYKTVHPEVAERANRMIEHAKETIIEMRAFIWEMDSSKNSLHDFLVLLKKFGEQLYGDTQIQFDPATMEESYADIKLTSIWRQELMPIFREAMNNALIHSQASCVTLSCTMDNHGLILQLVDNGRGFDPTALPRENGLINMRERAAKLAGFLDIETAKHRGTLIRFRANLPDQGVESH